MSEPFMNLANAIILQAVKDYRVALRKHQKRPKYQPSIETINEVERFFRSEWYRELTSVDGEMLIKKLKSEVEKSETKRISSPGISARP